MTIINNFRCIFFYRKTLYYLPFLLLISILFNSIYAQNSQHKVIRRHFIVAFDISSPFLTSYNTGQLLHRELERLFENRLLGNFSGNISQIENEKQNGIEFFEPATDIISFYFFGITENNFYDLRYTSGKNYTDNKVIELFNDRFLPASLSNIERVSLFDILQNYSPILRQRNLFPFGRGVSLSNFVYPAILEKIDSVYYPEETILIIMSDFLTGSQFGNNNDEERIKEIYANSNVASIVIDHLNHKKNDFFTIDYFYLADRNTYPNKIAAYAYKIKPRGGYPLPENTAFTLDSEPEIWQNFFNKDHFSISGIDVKGLHNKSTKIKFIEFEIKTHFADEYIEHIIGNFDTDKSGHDYSDLWVNGDFERNGLNYYVPQLTFDLPKFNSQRNSADIITINYKIATSYISGGKVFNATYVISKETQANDVAFADHQGKLIMIIIIIILVIIILAYWYGRPIDIQYRISGFVDSFEVIDATKVQYNYKGWKNEEEEDYIAINGTLKYRNIKYPLNHRNKIYAGFDSKLDSAVFDFFLTDSRDSFKHIATDYKLEIEPQKSESGRDFRFFIGIKKNGTGEIKDFNSYELRLTLAIFDLIEFPKVRKIINKTLSYKFRIGPELGNTWVAFDPGTVGSCIKIGNDRDSKFSLTSGKSEIIHSLIAFNKNKKLKSTDVEKLNESNDDFLVGTRVQPFLKNDDYIKFKSIKKLIGYKNSVLVSFNDGQVLKLTGQDLAYLLTKSIYSSLKSSIEKDSEKLEKLNMQNGFNPARAILAVPNSFTLFKIREFLKPIQRLGVFKEVRFVYEAEAVLFNFLSKQGIDEGKILVIDMGGGSINFSLFTVDKRSLDDKMVTEISTEVRIGYSVGGDTIDYSLLKIFERSLNGNHTELSKRITKLFAGDNHNGTVDWLKHHTKINLQEQFILKRKIELIDRHTRNEEQLLDSVAAGQDFESTFSDAKSAESLVLFNKDEFDSFFAKNGNNYGIFTSQTELKELVYDSVTNGLHQIKEITDIAAIDYIILSGRSISFPGINSAIKKKIKQLKISVDNNKIISTDIDDSKLAVVNGALHYAITKDGIRLRNSRSMSTYGFILNKSMNQNDFEFISLIKIGDEFIMEDQEGKRYIENTYKIDPEFATFNFNNGTVSFYQVMESDPKKLIINKMSHKYVKIGAITLDQRVLSVKIRLDEDDNVQCSAELENGNVLYMSTKILDQEITAENKEHYYWNLI